MGSFRRRLGPDQLIAALQGRGMRDVGVFRVLQGEKKGLLVVGRDVIEPRIRRSDMSFYATSIEYRCRETRPKRIHTFCQTRKSADRQCTDPAARRQDEFRKQIRSRRTEAGVDTC